MDYSEHKIELAEQLNNLQLIINEDGYNVHTFWCRFSYGNEPYNTTMHTHTFYELHLFAKGNGTIRIDNKETDLSEGDMIIISPLENHALKRLSDDVCRLVWGFSVQTYDAESKKRLDCFNTAIRTKNAIPFSDETVTAIELLSKKLRKRDYNYLKIVEMEMYVIFNEILNSVLHTEVSVDETAENKFINKRSQVKEIEKYIKENIGNQLTATDIAKKFSVCEKHLSRICIECTGMPIGKYVKKIKMDKAKEYLITSDKSIGAIANAVGYDDAYTFSKAFKKYETISPVAFRKLSR